MHQLAGALRRPPPPSPAPTEAFRQPLTQQIGYTVPARSTVGLIFAAFLLGTLALGLLRRSRRPELLGWLAPAAALAVAAGFVALGESSRRAAPPTVAFGQVALAIPGTQEVALHGLLATYRPESGPAVVGAEQGGSFELDLTGLEGQTRRLVRTDLDAWHWENLGLPAGVRFAPFRYTTATATPITAVAGFGPQGVEGRLSAGPFQDVADALLSMPGSRNLAIRLRPDGTFRATSADALPAGQFLASTLLSDRQQRRQDLYREFLGRPGLGRQGRTLLLAWASPLDPHFTFGPEVRQLGDALLVAPLRLERPAPGTTVTIPGPLVSCQRMTIDGPTPLTLASQAAAEMPLRFQVPVELLPLTVERARLALRIHAPGRRITIASSDNGKPSEIHRVESPATPIRLTLTDAKLLSLDKEGALYLTLGVSEPREGARGGVGEKWTIQYIELEITGRTADDKVTR
jgi:hypothetical protein